MKNKTLLWLFVAFIILLIFGELFAKPAHPVFFWHKIPAYQGIIGLIGCLIITLAIKWTGKKFLQKPEDYDDELS